MVLSSLDTLEMGERTMVYVLMLLITSFSPFGDVCVFTSSSVCVNMWGFSVGAILWASGACRLIRLLATVTSPSRSLIDVYPSPFANTLSGYSRFWMALTTLSTCLVVEFVMCLCWNNTVSNIRLALVLLNRKT